MTSKSAASSTQRFVGREQELATLVERLRASEGTEVVLIGGEPGVGKTRLIHEAATAATDLGWRVLIGHSYDSEGMPPYLPFIEALQDYVHLSPSGELARYKTHDLSEVAILVPELRHRLPDLPMSTEADPRSARYRLFESVSEFLSGIARVTQSGLLLCLEDLHWADDSTLLLLEHFARRSGDPRILIFATYRDAELDVTRPLARTIEQFSRLRLSLRLDLKGLLKRDVATMIAALGQPDPPTSFVDIVYGETEGNPFFVQEVVEYLASEGRLFEASGAWRTEAQLRETEVPQSIRLVIGRRLERVSEDCRRVLSVAAVIGHTAEYDLLRVLVEVEEEVLLNAIDEALRLHLLASGPNSHLSFTHELIRQTLLGSLSPPRRQLLHHSVGEAIERLYASNLEGHFAELASHYRMSGKYDDYERAIDFSVRAGDRARKITAYEDALRLYRMGLEIFEASSIDHPQQSIAEGLHASRGATLIAELHAKCGAVYLQLWQRDEARKELEAAKELLGWDHTELRSAVLSNLAEVLALLWDTSAAVQNATEALELAESTGQKDLVRVAMLALANAEVRNGNVEEGMTRFRFALPPSGEAPGATGYWSSLYWYPLYLYWVGQAPEAVQVSQQFLSTARDPAERENILPHLGLALAAKGLYNEAFAAFSEALRLSQDHRGMNQRTCCMAGGVHLDLYDYDGAEALAEEARATLRPSQTNAPPVTSSGIDLILNFSRRGQVDRADKMLGEVSEAVEKEAGGLHAWLFRLRLAEARAEFCLAKGEWLETISHADEAIERSHAAGRVKYEALGLETRGLALARLGRQQEASNDLRRAVKITRPVGDPVMFLRAASALLSVERDQALAAEAFQAVESIRAGLSDTALLQTFLQADPVQLICELAGLKNRRQNQARPQYRDNLSQREVDVLRLIAAGKTNPQIAEELVISRSTVQNHVSSILTKAGLANRAEAVVYALRHGLT